MVVVCEGVTPSADKQRLHAHGKVENATLHTRGCNVQLVANYVCMCIACAPLPVSRPGLRLCIALSGAPMQEPKFSPLRGSDCELCCWQHR
jgi:hypothetical protein